MGKKRGSFNPDGLTIDYKALGTISIDELAHALIEDIQALKDNYNIRYVRRPRLRFLPTDEYGGEVRVRRPAGGTVRYLHEKARHEGRAVNLISLARANRAGRPSYCSISAKMGGTYPAGS